MREVFSVELTAGLRLASSKDFEPLTRSLSRAFIADPFYNWLIPNEPARAGRRREFFELILKHLSDDLSATFITDDAQAGAIWLPPGTHQVPLWRKALLLPAFIRVLGWSTVARGLHVMDHMDGLHARYAPAPHYYLSVLGVDPELQGRGAGTALLAPMLERCRRERKQAYLETASEKNVAFYQRRGFELRAKTEHAVFPTFWSMTYGPAH